MDTTSLPTDIEGSTRLWEQHPEAMSQAPTLQFRVPPPQCRVRQELRTWIERPRCHRRCHCRLGPPVEFLQQQQEDE